MLSILLNNFYILPYKVSVPREWAWLILARFNSTMAAI